MADQDRLKAYAEWLTANTDKQGTPEFNKVADAYKQLRQQPESIIDPPAQEPKLPNNSLGAAVRSGELGSQIGTRQFLNDTFDGKGWFEEGHAAVQDAFNSNVYNPLARMVGAEERVPTKEQTLANQSKNQQRIDQMRDELSGLNYQPKIAGVGDIGSVADAGQYVAERVASSASPMAASILTGGTLAPVQMMGETNESLREIEGLDPETRLQLATSAGALMGVAENLGAGTIMKMLPAGILQKMGAEKLGSWLLSKGIIPATARTVVAGLSEGGTEAAQEGIKMGAEAFGGKEFADGEVGDRLAESFASGAAVGSGIRAPGEITGGTIDTIGATKDALGRMKATSDYGNNPTQVQSDLRVADLYDRKAANFTRQDTIKPAQVFKGVMDELKSSITKSVKLLHEGGQITTEQRDGLLGDADAALKQAANHNRTFTEAKVISLGLEPAVEQGLINAFHDLDTASQAALYKNGSGPVEAIAKKVSGAVTPAAVAAAATTGNPAFLGGLAAKALLQKGARGIDSVLGLQEPEILRRASSRRKMAQAEGINYGDTTHFLGDLLANAQAGLTVQNSLRADANEDTRLTRADRRRQNNPGLGGFDAMLFTETGLTPQQVDQGIIMLARDGQITPEETKQFFGNPRALMAGNKGNILADKLHQLAIDGRLQRDPTWTNPNGRFAPDRGQPPQPAPPQQGSGIRNPEAYSQTMANVAGATNTAQTSAPSPELAGVVSDIANARTKADKRALYAQAISKNPEHGDWLDSAVKPLLGFGPREPKNTSE